MRYLFCLLCCAFFTLSLAANTGPGRPMPINEELAKLIKDVMPATEPAGNPVNPALLAPPTASERAALASAFAAPSAISGTGDDLRKVAAFTTDVKNKVDSARAILNMVRDEARQLQNLVDAQLASLPLGIKQTIGNTEVFIAIAEARLTASAAEVDIYCSIDLPDTDQDPIFMAKGIGWSRQGGFVGDIELELIADWGIDFNAGRSRLILRADDGGNLGGTFVKVNCDGFVAGRINATVLFSRNWVLPVVNGEPLTDELLTGATSSEEIYSGERVQADFVIDIDAQNGFDFLAQVTVDEPFVFKGKEQVEVTLGTLAIDLSDVVNPDDMSVPPNYVSPHGNGPGPLASTWQGFYLAGLKIKLPEKLSKDGNPPIEVGAPYLIIDKMGITVHLYAENLLPLGEKSADGWAFSVDRVDLKITANQFEEAGIDGLINVPLLAKAAASCGGSADTPPVDAVLQADDCLLYSALFIAGGDVYFTIESQTDYCADLWKAEVIIEANSKLMLAYEDDQFNASTLLFGSISIDAQINDNFGLTMSELSFDSLVLSNRPQYFSPGIWDFPEAITAQFGAFSLGFEHISMALDPTSSNTDGRDVALSFQAWFNLDAAMDIDVAGAFQILGTLNEEDDRQKWRFKRIKVNAIQVEASTDSWSLGATIAFYENDSEWGTGFYGSGHLFLTMVGGDIGFAAVAQFGTAPNSQEKYFFVDVIARLGSGIPLGPSGLKLMAIGGGVYTNMSRADGGEIQSFVSPDASAVSNAGGAVDDYENWDGTGSSPLNGIVGISTSGIAYEVDLGNKFGAFLQVVIAGPSPEAFSVNARLELIVNDDGGWQARIDGNIMIMAPINYTNEYKIESGVGIFVSMAYTHTDSYKGFQASADVFINVAGGIIQGANSLSPPSDTTGSNKGEYVADGLGYAGGVSMEFSTETWYIHIGHPTPNNRIAIEVGVGPISVTFTSYFCIGKLVPPIPPLPYNVTAITGDIDMSRDFAQYENASGFAFGASLSLESGGKFAIFYYEVAAGIGFDVNIRKYGDAICAGGGANAPSIGINGWYAAGQAWAYVSGSIGIDVKLIFVTVRKEILSAGVAAVLQLKGPNPTWARGTLAGYYSIMGGLFKGNFSINAEFGENCVITGRGGGDPFANVDVLSGMSPDDDVENVDINTTPTAYLIMPLNEETELGSKKYRVMWLETKLRKVYNGYPVAGTIVKTPGTYSIQFIPDEFLAGETEYEIKVKVMLQSRPLNSGPWTLVKNEELIHRFTTGPALDSISPSNVVYSYPLAGQANYYRNEFQENYLKVERTQPTLTADITAVYRISGNSLVITRPVTYNSNAKEYTWTPGAILPNRVYKLELVQNYQAPPPGGGNNGGGGSVPGGGQQQAPGNGNGLGNGSGPSAFDPPRPTLIAVEDQKTIHTIFFRSSQYSTWTNKVNAIVAGMTSTQNSSEGPKLSFPDTEALGPAEISGHEHLDGPMLFVRVSSSETWSSGIKQKIINQLPANFNYEIPGYQNWNSLSLSLPYNANYFEETSEGTNLSSISSANFTSGNVAGIDNGSTLVLGFPRETRNLVDEVSYAAKNSLETIIEEEYTEFYDFPQARQRFRNMLNFIDCFPTMHDSYENWLPEGGSGGFDDPYGGGYNNPPPINPPPFAWSMTFRNEPVPSDCDFPPAFIDFLKASTNYSMLNYNNATFPVRFKLTLPGGKHEKSVLKTVPVNY